MLTRLVRRCYLQPQPFLCTTRLFASETDPVRISYNVFGENNDISGNTPLIIMHGLFGSKQNWRSIARALESKLKKRVYTVDARNHGDSEHSPFHSSASMAADLVALMKDQGLSKACVMGHSMGGRTMMYFALKYPHLVESGIIVDISPVYIPRDVSGMHELLTAMKNISVKPELSIAEGRRIAADQILDAADSRATVDFIMLNLKKRENGEFYWSVNLDSIYKNLKHFSNFEAKIASIPPYTGPMRFICGSHSNFFKQAHWPAVQKIFPNSDLHWLDAGHLVHFDKPHEFIQLVVDFLKK